LRRGVRFVAGHDDGRIAARNRLLGGRLLAVSFAPVPLLRNIFSRDRSVRGVGLSKQSAGEQNRVSVHGNIRVVAVKGGIELLAERHDGRFRQLGSIRTYSPRIPAHLRISVSRAKRGVPFRSRCRVRQVDEPRKPPTTARIR
jgi:hypothetical protein